MQSTEITIEIGDDRNRQVLFAPTQEKLRGRWSNFNSNGARSMHPSLAQMPAIPGIYLRVNLAKRQLTRLDPLKDTEEGRRIWEQVQRILEADSAHFNMMKPWDKVVVDNAPENQVKTWVYWFCRLVESNQAKVISGELPTKEELARMPGRALTEQFNFYRQSPTYADLGEEELVGAGQGRRSGSGGKDDGKEPSK